MASKKLRINEKSSIGNRIQYVRELSGLSQIKFSDQLKVSLKTLGNYELDKSDPKVNFCLKMAEMFHISSVWLLTGEGSPDLPQEAETAADAGDGSDQGQNALKHGSGHSGIDKANRVNVNLAHSKTKQGDEMSVQDKDILIKYLKNDVSRLEKKVSDLEAEVLKLRENQREAANQ